VKTISLRKKVALFAATVITVGTLGTTTSNASDWSSTADLLDCQIGLTTTNDSATGCTQVAGGRVSIGFTDALLDEAGLIDNDGVSATISNVFVSVTGASIVGTVNSGTGVLPETITTGEFIWSYDGVNDADGLIEGRFLGADAVAATNEKVADTDDNNYIVLTSAVASTATVTLFQYNASGIRTVIETHKVIWLAANTTDLASVHISTIADASVGADCTVASKDVTTNHVTRDVAASGSAATLCVIALDGNGAAKTGTTITVTAVGSATFGGAAVGSSVADADGIYTAAAITANGIPGTGTFTATVTSTNADGTANTKTASTTMSFAGATAKTATLTQTVFALDESAAKTNVATFSVKDTAGLAIVKADDNATSLVIDSDFASTSVIDVAGEEDAEATVVIESASSVSVLGVETQGTISVTCSATKLEQITIKMHLEDNTVASNTITVWCTEAIGDITTETIAVEVVDAAAGAKQTVKATVLLGGTAKPTYPVADIAAGTAGGAVFSTGGGTFQTSAPKLAGGVATTDMFASAVTGNYTLVVAAGGVSNSKAFKVTGGVDTTGLATSIASLNAKIVALNALIAKIMKRLNIR
jgi:hypothetical protein